MEMVIQNILLPQAKICSEEAMYFFRENYQDINVIIHEKKDNKLVFQKYGTATFSTYFNGLSVKKWKKYTNIGKVSLVLKLKGHFEIDLISVQCAKLDQDEDTSCKFMDKTLKSILHTAEVDFSEPDFITIPYSSYDLDSALGFSLRSLDDGSEFWGGYYVAEIGQEQLKDTDIAINICTFRREDFILRNLDILREQIIENESSPLSRHLQVYISDNGQTLPREKLNSEFVHIVPNKNVGGAGGFTRGLMEILDHQKDFPATHALMMDDDIVICPEALFRTYALLRCRKDEYEDVFVGGAMMRLDNRSIQVESGASWNAGKLVSNKQGLDMRYLEDVLMNEVEEYTEYNAWWYCCTPMRLVSKQNLPMPIFIRGDDLEYGLRNMKHLILMKKAESDDTALSFSQLLSGHQGSCEYQPDPDSLCTIMFTSGTTGKSKGVMLTHRNLAENATCLDMKIPARTVILSVLPIHHAYCLSVDVLKGLSLGSIICINDSLIRMAKNIQLFKPEMILMVPLMIETMAKKLEDAAGLPPQMVKQQVFGEQFHTICSGGAYLNPALIDLFERYGITILQGYGMTECAPVISTSMSWNIRKESVGQLMPNCEAKVVDGELWVRGSSVMMGYYQMEKETAEVLTDGWLHTGDLGYVDEDGFVYLTGRKKNLIITKNGENVSPEELENKLGEDRLVQEILVRENEGVIEAEIFPDLEYAAKKGIEDLQAALQERIDAYNRTAPAHKRVYRLKVRETEFEKTPSKKIKRY